MIKEQYYVVADSAYTRRKQTNMKTKCELEMDIMTQVNWLSEGSLYSDELDYAWIQLIHKLDINGWLT